MDSMVYRLLMLNHRGPIKLGLNFINKYEGEFLCTVNRNKENLEEDNCQLKFYNKTKIIISP